MRYFHRVVVNATFFLAMCVMFAARWYYGITDPMGGFYGVIAGVLLLNAIGWGEL